MSLRKLIGLFVLVAAVGLVLSPRASALADDGAQKALRAALFHMKEAKEEIKDERLKGHHDKIEKNVNTAIKEIEFAAKEGKFETKFEPVKGWDKDYKSFKHLRQAVVELKEAKKDLAEEKGDWARRKELRAAIDDAIEHLDTALKDIR
jgi:hypothetical protein